MYDFAQWVQSTYGAQTLDFHGLHRWSVENLEDFWRGVWDCFGVVASSPGERTLEAVVMPGARWFPGAALN